MAISGYSSLEILPFLFGNTKFLGIVNKECVVSAGHLFKKLNKKNNTIIYPLDSEHYSLNNIEGVNCALPGGAFYAFPNFDYYLGKSFHGKEIKDSFDLSNLFLDIAKVVTVPGDGFGAPAHIRFSYPIGKKLINEGINRVKNILNQLN